MEQLLHSYDLPKIYEYIIQCTIRLTLRAQIIALSLLMAAVRYHIPTHYTCREMSTPI